MDVQTLSWFWPAVVAGSALLLLGLGYWLYRRSRQDAFERTLARVSHRCLRHVLIPDGMDGLIHLDYLLLTSEGLLVIDVKEVRGAVFGAEKMDKWTVMNGSKRFTFRNPLGPLQERIAALRGLLPGIRVDGVVVITGAAEFPKGVPPEVVPVDRMIESRRFTLIEGGMEPPPVFLDAWARVIEVSEPYQGSR